MAQGDIWHIAAIGKLLEQEVVNVFHFRFKTAGASIDVAHLRVEGYFLDALNDHLSNKMKWHLLRSRQLVGGTAVAEKELTPGYTGAVATDPLPTQVALIVSLRTGQAGRRKRGRLYIPGLPEDQCTQSKWHAAALAAYQPIFDAAIAAFKPGGTDPDYEWGVYSRVNGGTLVPGSNPPRYGPPWSAAGFQGITQAIVRDVPATQRRRRLGVGS